MEILEYLSKNRIKVDLKGKNKEEVIKEMAQVFVKDGILNADDLDEFISSIYEREKLSPTGMQDGVAIPHTKTHLIKKESRNYAKRQLTWFKKEKNYIVYNFSEMSECEIIEDILKRWKNF